MRRLVRTRHMVLALIFCVTALGGVAGVTLWHAFRPVLALSSPSLQTSSFQVDQLQLQYERFLESLWAFAVGRADVAAVSLRLDILASRVAPARELSGVSGLAGPSDTLRELDRRIEGWTVAVAGLGDRDGGQASLRRVADLREEVKSFQSSMQDMVVETNRAFNEQRDRERHLFLQRFNWLLKAIAALAIGVVVLVGFLWRQLARSGSLGRSLARLNVTLEERVKQRTTQVQERERQLHAILDASPIAVAMLRLDDHQPLFMNQRFKQQFLIGQPGVSGAPMGFESIFSEPGQAKHFWHLFDFARVLDDHEALLRDGTDGGRTHWALVSARELIVDGLAVLLFWAYDISTRKQLEVELRQLAHTDPLTGVLNRRAFTERSVEAVAAAHRQQRPLAVLMLDVDHFKRVNDQHSHAVGDAVLQQVASMILGNLRAVDLLGRLGGEEFGVVLPGTSPREAELAAERVRAAIAADVAATDGTHATEVKVTVSIGMTCLMADDNLDALFRRADAALYRAKRAGRDQVQVADGESLDSMR